MNVNPEIWINTLPKKNENNSIKKYSLTIILFVAGLIFVSVVKNETRNLQKEISNLQTSINILKYDLHQTTLDHEIITSPENISRLAKEYLEYSNLLPTCDIGLSTVIIEKKILKNFKFPSTKTKEDYILWLNLTKKKYNFYGYQNSLTKWRKLDNSLSSSTYQKLVDGFKVYNKYLKLNLIISFIYLIRLSINFLLKD